MKTHHVLAGIVLATTLSPDAQGQVQPGITSDTDPYHRQFFYFLPKATVGATITQRITKCPEGFGEDIRISVVTVIAIGSKTAPDPKAAFTVDARAGFLSKRATKLALRADGTLASFNVTSEGQGGEVVSAAIKIGSTLAGWSIPGVNPAPRMQLTKARGVARSVRVQDPPKPLFRCRAAISKALDRLTVVRREIADLETKIVQGLADGASIDLLARHRAEAEELVEALSLSAGDGIGFSPSRDDFARAADSTSGKLPVLEDVAAAPAYEEWLEVWDSAGQQYRNATAADVATLTKKTAGAFGFRVALTVDDAMYDLMSGSPEVSLREGVKPLSTDRFVFYRRPIPAKMSVAPCASPSSAGPSGRMICIPATTSPGDTQAGKSVVLPQLSGLYSLSIGRGGLFGTREAKVELDENGAPTALEYGSGAGGAEIAKVMDSGLAAATALRDARATETRRKIDAIKAENELEELLSGDDA